jgi:patatin-like phospholipase/acyl hydrolase
MTGPKRILALDGGGIRGVLTLEYLEAIEALIRQRRNDPALLLSDCFDLIGGTSTGSTAKTAHTLRPTPAITCYLNRPG